jgi:hypothetical protein
VVWELVFMLVILKIPVAYLCGVVWWAVKSEPRPLEGAAVTASIGPEPLHPNAWRARHLGPRGPRNGPHGAPVRSPLRPRRAAVATARGRR